MPVPRPHEESMRDYIELLKRDLAEYTESRTVIRIEQTGEAYGKAKDAVRTSSPIRKRKKRLRKAEADLERYLVGVAYWKEKEVLGA